VVDVDNVLRTNQQHHYLRTSSMSAALPDRDHDSEPEQTAQTPSPPTTGAGYPSLQPALHLQIQIGPASHVGSLSRGAPLTVVPLVSGTLRSEPGFPVDVDAWTRAPGVDYVHNDPDGSRMRLRSDLVVADTRGEVRWPLP